ncbi:MAG: phosphate ABC transporter substrate-binding protein PstS [Rhodomicrobium sp.]
MLLTISSAYAFAVCALLTALPAPLVFAADFSGADATFPYPIYAKWAEAYKTATGKVLSYKAIGSAAGIEAVEALQVTFGASDAPLTPWQPEKGGDLVQWPMVMGGIVPVVNLDGIKPNGMVLDGHVLAGIFLGEIKTWDDPRLKKLNAGLSLPPAAITVVHRSDGSGTTFNFTKYLSNADETWKAKVGSNTIVEWPTGTGAKGNQGVAGKVQETKNSIGYVEAAFAKQNKLTVTRMINNAGKAVEVGLVSVRAAAANWWWTNSDWLSGKGLVLNIINQPGEAAWPIAAATFILMPAQVTDAEATREALNFFAWAYANGDQAAEELDYVPLPLSVKHLAMQIWTAIRAPDGKPVYDAR